MMERVRQRVGGILQGRRTGLRLKRDSIDKDVDGFDDLDAFWTATRDKNKAAATPNSRAIETISTPSTVEMSPSGQSMNLDTPYSVSNNSLMSESEGSDLGMDMEYQIALTRSNTKSNSIVSSKVSLRKSPRFTDEKKGSKENINNSNEALVPSSVPNKRQSFQVINSSAVKAMTPIISDYSSAVSPVDMSPLLNPNRRLTFNINNKSSNLPEVAATTSTATESPGVAVIAPPATAAAISVNSPVEEPATDIEYDNEPPELDSVVDYDMMDDGSNRPPEDEEQEEEEVVVDEDDEDAETVEVRKESKTKKINSSTQNGYKKKHDALHLPEPKYNIKKGRDKQISEEERQKRTRRASLSEVRYDTITNEEESAQDCRRSKRVKMAPLKYWKNERPQYQRDSDELPSIAAVTISQPTPKVSRKRNRHLQAKDKAASQNTATTKTDLSQYIHVSSNIEPFDTSRLDPSYVYVRADKATVWDENTSEYIQKRIIAYGKNLKEVPLPVTGMREEHEDKVALAVQTFHVPEIADICPSWISGHLMLPPKSIKDAEGVGLCSQVFFVSFCQPLSLEVAIAKADESEFNPETCQRYLLSPGDHFYIPPNNVYRLENHSESASSKVFWTIIKPN